MKFQFWVNRLDKIPGNLILQASRGSYQDDIAIKYNLKYAEVFRDINDVPKGMPIDTDDSHAMSGSKSFALLDNTKYSKKVKIV
jgi:phosphoglucomutase